MEDLFDFEFAGRVLVGATAARFGEYLAAAVGELADGLGAAGIYA
jgi:hypothetical protein